MPDGPKLKVQDLIRDGGFDSSEHPVFHSFVAEIIESQTKEDESSIKRPLLQ